MASSLHLIVGLTRDASFWYEYGMKKVAISLPDSQAEAIEKIRRKSRVPRSRVIQQAIAFYLSARGHLRDVRAYEHGYERKPEGIEAEAFAKATTTVLAHEDWK